jgi:hypothetical protein
MMLQMKKSSAELGEPGHTKIVAPELTIIKKENDEWLRHCQGKIRRVLCFSWSGAQVAGGGEKYL